MSSSLEKLVENLLSNSFKYTSKVFNNKEKNKLMKKKGVYPYDYMDSFGKFDEFQLSNKENFYSILNNENITDDQY